MADELKLLLDGLQEAGAAILKVQNKDFAIKRKTNFDMVTEADLLANDILQAMIKQHFPNDGWLSEESVDDQTRLNYKRVWIVDPIDGTREFAHRIPEYAISIALVENNEPILAAVFNPATNELFHATKGGGAWLNGQQLVCKNASSTTDFLILASRTEYQRGKWNQFASQHRVQPIGSIAYKLALVAANKADATFSLSPKNEWDIAAGVLLVSEAGGVVTNIHKETFLFNQKEVLVNGIVATAGDIMDQVFALIDLKGV